MNKHKRLLSLLLAVVMVIGMVPLTAVAQDGETQPAVASCEYCKVDLVEGALHSVGCPTTCTCDPKPAEGEAHAVGCPLNLTPVTTSLDGETTGNTTGNTTNTTGNTTSTTEGTTAATTQATTVATTEATTVSTVLCDKCGTTESNEDGTVKHAEDCETLKPLCDKCNATKNATDDIIHAEDCITNCICDPKRPAEEEHTNEMCKFFEKVSEPDEVTAFIEFMKALPVSEIQNYFQTKDALEWAQAAIPVDVDAEPEKEQSAFSAAEAALVQAMETDAADLESTVNDLLFEMLIAYEDANWAVEDGIENHMGEDAALLETYEALLAYVDTGMQTYADTGNTFTPQVVGQVTNNINVTLFDYGSYITNPTYAGKDYRTLVFHGWPSKDVDVGIHDENGTANYGVSGKFPILTELKKASSYNAEKENFTTDLKEGYPFITEWKVKGGKPSADGSLQYLFDLNGPAYRAGDNGNSQYVPQYNSDGTMNESHSNYEFKRFNVGTVQLFKKNGSYYEYNSSYNAAYYSDGKLASYNYALRPQNTGSNAQGHFLPFNSFYDGNGLNQKDGVVQVTNENAELQNNPHPSNTLLSWPQESAGIKNVYALTGRTNMAYGMLVDFTFSMPKNGQVDGENMVFDFCGDDDVYVYIDGYPVLNIGGTHGAWSGTIDFATGAVNVYNSENTGGVNQENDTYETQAAIAANTCTTLAEIFQTTFPDSGVEIENGTLKEYTEHTLHFFYMERGAGAANCRLKFNLQLIPEAVVSVEKQEENINHALNAEYTFQLLDGASSARPNERYTITNSDGTEESDVLYTDSEGKFTLKHGEKANFKSLLAGQSIKIKEIKDDNDSYTTTCKMNDMTVALTDLTTGTIELDEDPVALVFTNTWDVEDVNISKTLDDVDGKAQDEFNFQLSINGTAYTGSATKQKDVTSETVNVSAGVFTLEADESITISGVPETWKFKVKELEPTEISGYKYEKPKFNNEENDFVAEVEYTAGTAVTVANKLTPLFGDLTITKEGIQTVDHDGSTEKQSTIFKVSGTSASGETVELEVVIVGNDRITIKNVPVGTNYTVTELDAWSWRYDAKEDGVVKNQKTDVVVRASEPYTEVIFENARTNQYWLSGDNYKWNLFSAVTATKPTE